MYHNYKLNKIVKSAGLFVLLLAFVFVSIAAASPAQASASAFAMEKYRSAQSSNLTEEEKIKSAIDAYFTTRYEGQRLLEEQDFSPVLEDAALEWVKKEKDKREIELYIARLFGFRYLRYEYTLDYDSITIKNDRAVVRLRESHSVIFETSAPVISKLGSLPHTITLRKKQGNWVISKDQYQDEGTIALDHRTKQELLAQVDENYRLNQQLLGDRSEQTNSSMFYPLPALNAYTYDRGKAVDYADEY